MLIFTWSFEDEKYWVCNPSLVMFFKLSNEIFLISHSYVAFIMVKQYMVKTHALKYNGWWVLPKNSTVISMYYMEYSGKKKDTIKYFCYRNRILTTFFPCIWYLMEFYNNIVKFQRHVFIVFLSQFTLSNVCYMCLLVHRTVIFPYYSTTHLPIMWKFHR